MEKEASENNHPTHYKLTITRKKHKPTVLRYGTMNQLKKGIGALGLPSKLESDLKKESFIDFDDTFIEWDKVSAKWEADES